MPAIPDGGVPRLVPGGRAGAGGIPPGHGQRGADPGGEERGTDGAGLRREMERAAEELRFEEAARLRDRLRAVSALENRQKVIAAAGADTDAVGFVRGPRSCFTVLHYTGGDLAGKDFSLLEDPVETDPEARRLFCGNTTPTVPPGPGSSSYPSPRRTGRRSPAGLRRRRAAG